MWLGMLVGRGRQEGRKSGFGPGQANSQGSKLCQELTAGAHLGAELALIHLTNLNDPALRNDGREQSMVTGMVTPSEPKDLDERRCETKNLVWERAS